MISRLMILLIRAYQLLLSPLVGQCCRFHPSCSHYFVEALQKHGCLRGTWLGVVRLFKCHPFHPGGHDPVPQPGHRSRRADDAQSDAGESVSRATFLRHA